jgi:hypothetical protein
MGISVDVPWLRCARLGRPIIQPNSVTRNPCIQNSLQIISAATASGTTAGFSSDLRYGGEIPLAGYCQHFAEGFTKADATGDCHDKPILSAGGSAIRALSQLTVAGPDRTSPWRISTEQVARQVSVPPIARDEDDGGGSDFLGDLKRGETRASRTRPGEKADFTRQASSRCFGFLL